MASEPLTPSARRRATVARALPAGLSLVLHAAIFAIVRGASPGGAPPAERDPERAAPPIEIDLGGRVEPEPPGPAPNPPSPPVAGSAPREHSPRALPRASLSRRTPEDTHPENGAAPSASGGPADAWSPPEGAGERPLPGLFGPPLWAVPGVISAPSAAPAPTSVVPRAVDPAIAGRVLEKALDERDKAKGIDLPAAGTIASELGGVVRASTAPLYARARFAARLKGSGRLAGVEVIQFTAGDANFWKGIAFDVTRRLAGRSFEIPPHYAAGATVFIEVVSVLQDVYGGKSDQAQNLLRVNKEPPKCPPPIRGDYPDQRLLLPTQCGPASGTSRLTRVVSTSFSVRGVNTRSTSE